MSTPVYALVDKYGRLEYGIYFDKAEAEAKQLEWNNGRTDADEVDEDSVYGYIDIKEYSVE